MELVKNLHPNYLPYRFLHILQQFLLWEKNEDIRFSFKLYDLNKKKSARVVTTNGFAINRAESFSFLLHLCKVAGKIKYKKK